MRGISIITIFKKAFENLLFKEFEADIDKNMSESNIGARKNRNMKDHLLIVYGIVNSVVKGKEDDTDIMVLDLEKAFDSLWMTDCLNDMFDTIEEENRNEKLALVYLMNKTNLVGIRTKFGLTKRENIPDIVQQGGIFGPTSCSVSTDKLGRSTLERKESFYSYKGKINTLPLTYIDDIQGTTKCGEDALKLGVFLTTNIEAKKLKFNEETSKQKGKCFKMHVGNDKSKCIDVKVHNSNLADVEEI